MLFRSEPRGLGQSGLDGGSVFGDDLQYQQLCGPSAGSVYFCGDDGGGVGVQSANVDLYLCDRSVVRGASVGDLGTQLETGGEKAAAQHPDHDLPCHVRIGGTAYLSAAGRCCNRRFVCRGEYVPCDARGGEPDELFLFKRGASASAANHGPPWDGVRAGSAYPTSADPERSVQRL